MMDMDIKGVVHPQWTPLKRAQAYADLLVYEPEVDTVMAGPQVQYYYQFRGYAVCEAYEHYTYGSKRLCSARARARIAFAASHPLHIPRSLELSPSCSNHQTWVPLLTSRVLTSSVQAESAPAGTLQTDVFMRAEGW